MNDVISILSSSQRDGHTSSAVGTAVGINSYKPPKTVASLSGGASGQMVDHRSLCRLAWAFSTSSMVDKAAWDILFSAASSSIDALTTVSDGNGDVIMMMTLPPLWYFFPANHVHHSFPFTPAPQHHASSSSSSRPLQPHKLYQYRTIDGWTKLKEPRPYRPSKYLRHNGPRIIVDSFDLPSAVRLRVHSQAWRWILPV